jgi:hypothetical protein
VPLAWSRHMLTRAAGRRVLSNKGGPAGASARATKQSTRAPIYRLCTVMVWLTLLLGFNRPLRSVDKFCQ